MIWVAMMVAMAVACVVSVAITAYFSLSILPAFVVGMACGGGSVLVAAVLADRWL